jgi:uncharacterized protein YceH (UPF0502 family)
MKELSAIEVRVLGSLIEKKETTPDQYPLTLNALCSACNQKTARNPVTGYRAGEIGHTLRQLESAGLVSEVWGARAARYEHLAGKALGIQSKALALLCQLMLRGPQTLGELKTNSSRLFAFDDLDDVRYALERLAAHEPPLAVQLPRQPGQKELRYAHLLAGQPDIPEAPARPLPAASDEGLEQRVEALEAEIRSLKAELEQVRRQLPS